MPSPTLAATPAIAASTPAAAPATPSEQPASGVTAAPGNVNTSNADPENKAVREAVLQRIDAMPLSQKSKDRLYDALDHAKGFGKLITINFASGRTELSPGDLENLGTELHRPKIQSFTDDPSVIIVVLGFADTRGDERTNKQVSDRRAQTVVDALRNTYHLANAIHSLGMGGQAIAGESLDKNRIVEIWAVSP